MNGTKLLLLDEPFEGLAPALGQKLGEIIQGIRHEGLAILIAESDDKRLDFIEQMHTIERGEILQDGDRDPEGQ
jgi:branched-chain amino acid transport system ATP-binding protein